MDFRADPRSVPPWIRVLDLAAVLAAAIPAATAINSRGCGAAGTAVGVAGAKVARKHAKGRPRGP